MSVIAVEAAAIRARRLNRHRIQAWAGQALTYAALGVALVFFLGPFFWIVTTSLKGNDDFFAYPPVWIPDRALAGPLRQAVHQLQRAPLLPQ